MKTKLLRRISVAIVAGLLITMSVLGVTLAKYTTSQTPTGTMTAATWDVKLNDTALSEVTTIDLGVTTYNHVAANNIAPGTSGQFTLNVANGGNVDLNYELTLTATEGLPSSIKFYDAAEKTTAKSLTEIATAASGNINMSGSKAVTIYWVWEFNGADVADTAFAGTTITIEAAIDATQLDPAN